MSLSEDALVVYAGCWVAIVRGRIVASGATAYQALLNCRAMRLKDDPILRFVPTRVHPVPLKQ